MRMAGATAARWMTLDDLMGRLAEEQVRPPKNQRAGLGVGNLTAHALCCCVMSLQLVSATGTSSQPDPHWTQFTDA